MRLDLSPNSKITGDATKMQKYVACGLKGGFKGDGWYFTRNATILVVKRPSNILYDAYVWTGGGEVARILRAIVDAPVFE